MLAWTHADWNHLSSILKGSTVVAALSWVGSCGLSTVVLIGAAVGQTPVWVPVVCVLITSGFGMVTTVLTAIWKSRHDAQVALLKDRLQRYRLRYGDLDPPPSEAQAQVFPQANEEHEEEHEN
ncbi:MAG: hypothetical protein IRY99_03440 [Isosphaeraceae bacterium]|nr:hypothetical protein [Isosphaeraceae bacterium]